MSLFPLIPRSEVIVLVMVPNVDRPAPPTRGQVRRGPLLEDLRPVDEHVQAVSRAGMKLMPLI